MRGRTLANLVIVTAFAAFCVAGLSMLAVALGLNVPGRPGWHLAASFAQTEGLVPQAEVRVSGVAVGHVLQLGPDGRGGTLVQMQMDPGVQLRRDTRAMVRPKSLIGEKYVELIRKPGSAAPYVQSGYVIPRSQTSQAVEIDDVLNNMDPETRQEFSTSLRNLGVAVDQRSGDINASIPEIDSTVGNLRPLARTAQARQAEIDRILSDLAVIMAALADEQDSLGRVVDSGNVAFGAMARRDQDLAGTVNQAAQLFGSLDVTFADLTPADRASLQKSPPTIASGRRLLALTNPAIDRLFPELLLAQVNYPNNELSVSHPEAVGMAYEWLSAFAQNDALAHSFRVTSVNDPNIVVRGGLPPAPPGGPPAPPGPPGSAPSAPDGASPDGGAGSVADFLMQVGR